MAKTDKIRVHLVLPEEKDEQENKEVEPVGVCPECGGELVVEADLSLDEAVCADCRLVSEVEFDSKTVSRTDHLTSEFRNRFNLTYQQFSEYVEVLEGIAYLSTEILEDRPEQREDIEEIYELTDEAFPEADVLMTEQYSPRNRNEEDFLAYSYDIIIRVCNIDPNSPTITQQIELTEPKIKDFHIFQGEKYIILTEDNDTKLVLFNLDKGTESWRMELDSEKYSGIYGFEEGSILITESNVFLLSWEDGAIQWKSEGVTPNGESGNLQWKSEGVTANGESGNQVSEVYGFEEGVVLTAGNNALLLSWEDGTIQWRNNNVTTDDESNRYMWEPTVSEKKIYATGRKGNTISQIDSIDGTIENSTILSSEIHYIELDDGVLYVITAAEGETNDEDDDSWRGSIKNYNFSLLSLSEGEIRWKTDLEESGRSAPTPYLTNDTVVIAMNDELKAYDRTKGIERWSLTQENFESELDLKESENSPLSSSISHMFELKILDSIGDRIYCVGRTKLSRGFLIAIDSMTGNIEWVNKEYNTIPYNTGKIHEHNGTVVFNHQENEFLTSFVALNSESGSEKWQFETPGFISGARSVGSEFVFITSEDCVVFET